MGKVVTALGAGAEGFGGRGGLEVSGVCWGLGAGVAAENLLDEETM